MPFIHHKQVDSVFYLHNSKDDALANRSDGGTGFFVHKISPLGNESIYAVTNYHVIKGGATVIRVNNINGRPGTIELDESDWVEHPFGADICVAEIKDPAEDLYFISLDERDLLTTERLNKINVRVGEEVYMIGRFIKHQGSDLIKPVARSGIISLMPDVNCRINYTGAPESQEAFLVEMRSLSGFSGSPVFYNLGLAEFINQLKVGMKHVYSVDVPAESRYVDKPELLMTVLGVDAGSFYTSENIEMTADGKRIPWTDYTSNVHTGFAVVIPGWAVTETINRKEFQDKRDQKDIELNESGGRSDGV